MDMGRPTSARTPPAYLSRNFSRRTEEMGAPHDVTRAGTTCSANLRKQAEEIAQAVAGMLQIDNRILSVPTRGSAFLPST